MSIIDEMSVSNIEIDNRYNGNFYKGLLCLNNKPVANFEYSETMKTGLVMFNYNVLKLGNALNYCLESPKHIKEYMAAKTKDEKNENKFYKMINEYFEENNLDKNNLSYIYSILINTYFKEKEVENGSSCK